MMLAGVFLFICMPSLVLGWPKIKENCRQSSRDPADPSCLGAPLGSDTLRVCCCGNSKLFIVLWFTVGGLGIGGTVALAWVDAPGACSTIQ